MRSVPDGTGGGIPHWVTVAGGSAQYLAMRPPMEFATTSNVQSGSASRIACVAASTRSRHWDMLVQSPNETARMVVPAPNARLSDRSSEPDANPGSMYPPRTRMGRAWATGVRAHSASCLDASSVGMGNCGLTVRGTHPAPSVRDARAIAHAAQRDGTCMYIR